jgi:DNA polymerase III subunit epsilon
VIGVFGWLRRPGSEAALAARREWRATAAPARATALHALRFVAVDTETSGLDPARDRLISIGACVVQAGSMPLDQCFAALLRQDRPSGADNVLIHGIGRAAQAAGAAPEAVLRDYLAFARRDVLVGYHMLFDLVVLQRAVRAALGIAYRPRYLDLALLVPALHGEGTGWDLDRWLQRYGLRAFTRHDALADAAAAAELLLVALERARGHGLHTLGQLLRIQSQQLELARLGSS